MLTQRVRRLAYWACGGAWKILRASLVGRAGLEPATIGFATHYSGSCPIMPGLPCSTSIFDHRRFPRAAAQSGQFPIVWSFAADLPHRRLIVIDDTYTLGLRRYGRSPRRRAQPIGCSEPRRSPTPQRAGTGTADSSSLNVIDDPQDRVQRARRRRTSGQGARDEEAAKPEATRAPSPRRAKAAKRSSGPTTLRSRASARPSRWRCWRASPRGLAAFEHPPRRSRAEAST
jgi:hypothetical protein